MEAALSAGEMILDTNLPFVTWLVENKGSVTFSMMRSVAACLRTGLLLCLAFRITSILHGRIVKLGNRYIFSRGPVYDIPKMNYSSPGRSLRPNADEDRLDLFFL